MQTRTIWREILGILLLAPSIASCEDDRRPFDAPPSTLYPNYQTDPTWGGDSAIAYREEGVVCIFPGGAFSVDTTLTGIWTLDLFSGIRTRIIGEGQSPNWSRDAKQLVFTRSGRISVDRFDSTGIVDLVGPGRLFFPRWNRLSTKIAFDSDEGDQSGHLSVWVMDADGGNRAKVPAVGADGDVRMADWSPDGTRLFHVRYPVGVAGTSELYVMNLDGSGVQRLTTNGASEYFPRVSPDGLRLAFVRFDGGGIGQIWIANADGSNEMKITSAGGTSPEWAPDGTHILYLKEDPSRSASTIGVLMLRDLTSGNDVQLTFPPPSQCP